MSLRLQEWLAYCFFLVGVGLLGWVAYSYFAPSQAPGLEAAATEVEVADGVAGQKRDVVLRLENRSGRPMRVLGLAEC